MSLPWLTGVLDTILDKSVVGGYSRLGSSARRAWWPADPAPGSLDGKRVVVTGASSGLGRATALGAARLGATVHLVGRSTERLQKAADQIRAQVGTAKLVVESCDVSDLDAVRAYASSAPWRGEGLHALVHNAGVMPPRRTTSAQGHETTLATHVLGPFLLSELLRDDLAADGDARVVWVSSGGMYTRPFTHQIAEDLEFERSGYTGTIAYARTKRMQVIVAGMLAERFAGDTITMHSMHPGWADTEGIRASMPRFHAVTRPILRTPAQGADTIVWLTASPEAAQTTGEFWQDRRPRPTTYFSAQLEDADDRQILWDFCCRETGVTPA